VLGDKCEDKSAQTKTSKVGCVISHQYILKSFQVVGVRSQRRQSGNMIVEHKMFATRF
jgi:hypothetical protein